MKKVVLLHTVRSVYETFADQLRQATPGRDLDIVNTLDEFLAVDANRRGEFTQMNQNRLFLLLKAADLAEADLIVATCSTLTPTVESVRPFLKTPVLAIDDAVMELAVTKGSRILVLATAGSAMGPATGKLRLEAAKAGREVEARELLCPEAFRAIQRMDRAEHDRLLLAAARNIDDTVDAVVLAQASMAHLEEDIAAACGRPVLSSPKPCFARIEAILYREEENR